MADRRILKMDASAALAAALFLCLQTMMMALSIGAHAVPAQVDAFGGARCINTGDGGAGGGTGDHHSLPDCCSLGCALASGSPLPAPPPVAAVATRWEPVAYALPESVARIGTTRASSRARGPPRRA